MTHETSPVLFFTGKGGVGKTSTACATAVALADAGRRVLLVSTDPASNLDEVLGVRLSEHVATPISAVPGLSALNIDPEAAARAYRERVVAPYREVLPAAVLASIEEQLSGACTVEIAAFDQFARLLSQDPAAAGYDHLVFDTAPTGHTLRLLELPAAWTGFFDTNTTGTSCLGPLSGLEAERRTYAAALASLRDAHRTRVVLVARPDLASMAEAARTATELRDLGVGHLRLIVNGVLAGAVGDPIAAAMAERAEAALETLPAALRGLDREDVPLLAVAPMGIEGLRALERARCGEVSPPSALRAGAVRAPGGSSLQELVSELAAGGRGVVLTMGKGGVGKTAVAATLATALADLGLRVHLTTTDPAGRVEVPARPGLRLSRLDPAAEVVRYTERVMRTAGRGLDEAGRALLAEDLRSPCTEEIAVFEAFARAVADGEDEIVVIDTAPTGHTLLLLDAAEAYHREVQRKPGGATEAVRRLLPRLRDPGFARVLLVTLPEATPVHEAVQLERDLARAGVAPHAWVINQALSGLELQHPVLRARQAAEREFIDEVMERAPRVLIIPWSMVPWELSASAQRAERGGR